jgi:hypothetical protein
MPAEILHVLVIILFLGPSRRWLLPALTEPNARVGEISMTKLAFYTIVAIVCTAILTPLEVITTRLVIQRNHASTEYNSVQQEVDGDAEEYEQYGDEEDVIGSVHAPLDFPPFSF